MDAAEIQRIMEIVKGVKGDGAEVYVYTPTEDKGNDQRRSASKTASRPTTKPRRTCPPNPGLAQGI